MRVLALLLAGAFIIAPISVRADDGAAALLSKHKAFVGWQFGDGTFSSLDMTGDTVYRAKDGTMKKRGTNRFLGSGVAYRMQYTNPETHTTYDDGFTGRIYWTSDENGFTRPELGDVTKYNLAFDMLRNEATTEMQAQSRGTATIDGTTVDVVRVSDPNSFDIDLYVDPQTGAYKRAVIDPDGIYDTQMNILAYADALPGKKVISKWSYGDDAGTGYSEWTSFKPNVAVTPEDLHPPKPIAYWTFGSGMPAQVRLTQYRIYVRAKINGVEGNFVFDSGDGGGVLLTQDFAARAHVKTVGSVTGYGIGGAAKQSLARIDTLQLGDSVLHNVVVQSQDLGYQWSKEEGVDYAADGLIGYDILAAAVVSLNLDAGTMTIEDPQTANVDDSKGLSATVDLTDAIPRLPMKIDNVQVNASLDTGNAGYVLYSPDLRMKYGVRTMVSTGIMGQAGDIVYQSSGGYIGGIGGASKANCGVLDDISLGPIIYKSVAACETQEWSGREILIGIDFLRHFNYVFDYPHARIVIIPRSGDS